MYLEAAKNPTAMPNMNANGAARATSDMEANRGAFICRTMGVGFALAFVGAWCGLRPVQLGGCQANGRALGRIGGRHYFVRLRPLCTVPGLRGLPPLRKGAAFLPLKPLALRLLIVCS